MYTYYLKCISNKYMYSAGRLLTNCTDYKSHNKKLWIVA